MFVWAQQGLEQSHSGSGDPPLQSCCQGFISDCLMSLIIIMTKKSLNKMLSKSAQPKRTGLGKLETVVGAPMVAVRSKTKGLEETKEENPSLRTKSPINKTEKSLDSGKSKALNQNLVLRREKLPNRLSHLDMTVYEHRLRAAQSNYNALQPNREKERMAFFKAEQKKTVTAKDTLGGNDPANKKLTDKYNESKRP